MNNVTRNDNPNRRGTVWKLAKQIVLSRRWLVLPPIALGILMFYWMTSAKRDIPQNEVPEQSIKVAVERVKRESVRMEAIGYGTVQSSSSWKAIAEVSGRIVELNPSLESGNWISENEILLRIDDRDYELRLAQRRADLESAKARVLELDANQAADQKSLKIEEDLLVVSRKDSERIKGLRRANAVSTSEIDVAEGNLLRQIQAVQRLENSLSLYPSKIASAKAQVGMAESAVDEAKRNVERTIIKSPVRGVISNADLEIGQVVASNQELFQVKNDRVVEIEAQISLSQINKLLMGDGLGDRNRLGKSFWSKIQAEIVTESGSEIYRWSGRPVRLTESFDSQTRTIGVVVEVVNKELSTSNVHESTNDAPINQSREAVLELNDSNAIPGAPEFKEVPRTSSSDKYRFPLKPGTYCEVHLYGEYLNNVITLRRSTLDGDQVYVVNELDGEFRLQSRKVGRGVSFAERIVIDYGLEPNELIVIRPPVPAIDGMKVRLQ